MVSLGASTLTAPPLASIGSPPSGAGRTAWHARFSTRRCPPTLAFPYVRRRPRWSSSTPRSSCARGRRPLRAVSLARVPLCPGSRLKRPASLTPPARMAELAAALPDRVPKTRRSARQSSDNRRQSRGHRFPRGELASLHLPPHAVLRLRPLGISRKPPSGGLPVGRHLPPLPVSSEILGPWECACMSPACGPETLWRSKRPAGPGPRVS